MVLFLAFVLTYIEVGGSDSIIIKRIKRYLPQYTALGGFPYFMQRTGR